MKKGLGRIQLTEVQVACRFPLHYAIRVAFGGNDFLDGQLKMCDSPLGVMTNGPLFKQQ